MIRSSYLILKQMTHRAFSLSCVLICLSLHIQPACAQDILKDANSDSSSLSTDDYFYFYECNYPSLPFTVKYEWEVKCNNGLIGYPPFIPLADFNQGVEKATYRIELPAGQGCRYRELNTQGKGIQVKESTGANGQQVIKATASKLSPIIKEPFGPDFTELFPRV